MPKNNRLEKAQREVVLTWIAEGLKTDQINKRAAAFEPSFKVSRQQVDKYRKSRGTSIRDLAAAGEMSALSTGLALKQNRVAVLQAMAEQLMVELFDEDLLWTDQVKGIGGGESWERVDYKEFNAAEVQQLRGVLDDIAKELGQRSPDVHIDNTFNFNLDDWKKKTQDRLKGIKKLPAR